MLGHILCCVDFFGLNLVVPEILFENDFEKKRGKKTKQTMPHPLSDSAWRPKTSRAPAQYPSQPSSFFRPSVRPKRTHPPHSSSLWLTVGSRTPFSDVWGPRNSAVFSNRASPSRTRAGAKPIPVFSGSLAKPRVVPLHNSQSNPVDSLSHPSSQTAP